MAIILDILSVSAIVAATSVVAGVIYYSFQIRHQTKMRQTDLIMRLYSVRDSKKFQESWKKVMAKEFEEYKDYKKWYDWSDFIVVGLFFEEWGFSYIGNL